MSIQIKYTDRDVRDHPEVYETVVEYLENYTGEFAYLIDCKMRVGQNMDLSVGMVRGVLNCMRNDPRVDLSNLPEPGRYETEAVVVPIRKGQARKKKVVCANEDFHERHGANFGDDEYYSCAGKYEIDRKPYRLPATTRFEAVAARTGQRIHAISFVEVAWFPNQHSFGFTSGWRGGSYNSGDLFIKTVCKSPGWVRNGILLTEDQANQLILDRAELDAYLPNLPPSQRKPLSMCGRCQW